MRNVGPFRLFLEEVQPLNVYLTALPFSILLLLLVFFLFGLYERQRRMKPFSELYLVVRATILWTLLLMSGSYLSKYDYSRIIVLLYFLFSLLFLNLGRSLFRVVESTFYQNGKGVVRILIIGAGRMGRDLSRRLREYEQVGYKVVGFLDDYVATKKNFPVIGTLKDARAVIHEHRIQEVYICDPSLSHDTILTLVSESSNQHVRFRILSNVFDLVSGSIDVARLESIPSLDVWKTQENWWVGAPKRLFDVLVATILLFVSLPLWLGIALLIFLEDGRPIILSQRRVGFLGKQFFMIKFRTMKKNTPKYADAPKKIDDPRVTKVGRVLRKTSLDELPQLINVVRDDMSMVGPRPEMPQKVAKYTNWQRKRLDAKPGITGLWQILGRKDIPLEENLEYDFYYINNQSPLLDITILLRTIPLVLSGKGAY